MEQKLQIVALCGSLRRGSYNRAALAAAGELLPAGVGLEILDLSEVPFFNEDVEAEGIPAPVAVLKDKLRAADAVLLSVPEYNYSLPPVLKNALDWVSRGEDPPLWGKPTAIMSASLSMLGGARVQYHLRQVCTALNMDVLNKPEVFIASARTKFDPEGRLTDRQTRQFIAELLEALLNKVSTTERKQ